METFLAVVELYKTITLFNNHYVANSTILKAPKLGGRKEIKVIPFKDVKFKCIFQSSPHFNAMCGGVQYIICTKLLSHVSMSQDLDAKV